MSAHCVRCSNHVSPANSAANVCIRIGESHPDGRAAACFPPYWDYPALVRVSNRSSISAIDKCEKLVVELQHCQYQKKHEAFGRMAERGQISGNDFARSCIRLELESVKKTKEFFHKHPLAEANSKSDPSYTWVVEFSGDLDEYFAITGSRR